MKRVWRRTALGLTAGVMSLLLTGCSQLMGGFADYDVSGYFQALLDSSYKGENTQYMTVAAATEETAQQNNATTVQNAAVNFCNTYGISPSEEQLSQLEEVMRQALTQADYTVRDEEKVDTGYTLEVEIDPIVNFNDLSSQIEGLRDDAREEAAQASQEASSQDEEDSSGSGAYDSDGYDTYGTADDYGATDGYDTTGGTTSGGDDSGEDSSSSGTEETVDANTLFVDKVVELCQEQLSSLRHSGETVTITLDIRQTEEGELQLDTNQLDTIDRTVLQFQS